MPPMHEIDYKVHGDDLQFVEIELDPGEAALAEAGCMMYMDEGIEMETIFGDGSQASVGFLGALMDSLIARYAVDERRVYITGMSNGAMMTHQAGIALSHRVAAIAPGGPAAP